MIQKGTIDPLSFDRMGFQVRYGQEKNNSDTLQNYKWDTSRPMALVLSEGLGE